MGNFYLKILKLFGKKMTVGQETPYVYSSSSSSTSTAN